MYHIDFLQYIFAILCLFFQHARCAVIYPNTEDAIVLDCWGNLKDIFKEHEGNTFLVQCKPCDLEACYVFGTGYYLGDSGICCAGVHDGKIANNGSVVQVNAYTDRKDNFRNTNHHGVQSKRYLGSSSPYFTLTSVIVPKSQGQHSQAITRKETTTTTTITPTTTTITTTPKSTTTTTTPRSSIAKKLISKKTSTTVVPEEAHDVKTSTLLLEADVILEAEEDVKSWPKYVTYILAALVCSAVAVLIVAIVVMRRKRTISRGCRQNGMRKMARSNDCVCYVGGDSSVRSLLNDMDTCERPCHLRETVERAMEPHRACSNRAEGECGSCEKEKCDFASKFDF